MENEKLLGRVRLRISNSEITDTVLNEYISTIQDIVILQVQQQRR